MKSSLKEKRFIEKKRRVYAVVCAVLAVVEIAAFYLCFKNLTSPVSAVKAMGEKSAKILLDAGHGGIDGGVSGKYSGVKESDLNLDVVYLIAAKFQEIGFETVLTRKTAEGLYGTTAKGFKKRDMLKRREIIEAARPVAVISVHQNYFPSSASRGGQVFYLKGSKSGERLAEALQNSFNTLYARRGVKKRKKATADFYILSCGECPSALVECGFLSNAKDEKLLRSDEFKIEIAKAVVGGVIEFLSQEKIIV